MRKGTTRYEKVRGALLAGAALVSMVSIPAMGSALALLSLEGRLIRADGTPESGNVGLIFRLYSQEAGGTAFWSESHSILLGPNGYYAVHLGGITPLPEFTGQDLWLGITVQGEQEMTPRTRLVSVPYALGARSAARADDAARLGGADASNYLKTTSPIDATRLQGTVPNPSLPSDLLRTTSALNGQNLSPGSVPNSALANPSVTVNAGAGLSGGGSVALGGR